MKSGRLGIGLRVSLIIALFLLSVWAPATTLAAHASSSPIGTNLSMKVPVENGIAATSETQPVTSLLSNVRSGHPVSRMFNLTQPHGSLAGITERVTSSVKRQGREPITKSESQLTMAAPPLGSRGLRISRSMRAIRWMCQNPVLTGPRAVTFIPMSYISPQAWTDTSTG